MRSANNNIVTATTTHYATATIIQWWSPSLNIKIYDQRIDISYHADYNFINTLNNKSMVLFYKARNKASTFRTLLLILAEYPPGTEYDYNRDEK